MVAAQEKAYGKYWLKQGSGKVSLDRVARNLGQTPPSNWTTSLAKSKLFSQSAQSQFQGSRAGRLLRIGKAINLDKVLKIGVFAVLANHAGKVVGSEDSPEMTHLMTQVEIAANHQFERGFPNPRLAGRVKEAMVDYLESIDLDPVILAGIKARLELQLSELQ